jgi:hypothetical protein
MVGSKAIADYTATLAVFKGQYSRVVSTTRGNGWVSNLSAYGYITQRVTTVNN